MVQSVTASRTNNIDDETHQLFYTRFWTKSHRMSNSDEISWELTTHNMDGAIIQVTSWLENTDFCVCLFATVMFRKSRGAFHVLLAQRMSKTQGVMNSTTL